MAMKNPYLQYKENNIKTASTENLTLMLYDGALKFINQGKLFIKEKNISEANAAIQRAQDIIQELNMTLDMQYDISENLRRIYDYILSRLVDANIGKNEEILDEVAELIRDLRDTWKEAMKLAKTGR